MKVILQDIAPKIRMEGTPQTIVARLPLTGMPGRHVESAAINGHNRLVLNMSDGTAIDAGTLTLRVTGPSGRAWTLSVVTDDEGNDPQLTMAEVAP